MLVGGHLRIRNTQLLTEFGDVSHLPEVQQKGRQGHEDHVSVLLLHLQVVRQRHFSHVQRMSDLEYLNGSHGGADRGPTLRRRWLKVLTALLKRVAQDKLSPIYHHFFLITMILQYIVHMYAFIVLYVEQNNCSTDAHTQLTYALCTLPEGLTTRGSSAVRLTQYRRHMYRAAFPLWSPCPVDSWQIHLPQPPPGQERLCQGGGRREENAGVAAAAVAAVAVASISWWRLQCCRSALVSISPRWQRQWYQRYQGLYGCARSIWWLSEW